MSPCDFLVISFPTGHIMIENSLAAVHRSKDTVLWKDPISCDHGFMDVLWFSSQMRCVGSVFDYIEDWIPFGVLWIFIYKCLLMIRTNSAHDPKKSSKTPRLVFWNTKILGIQGFSPPWSSITLKVSLPCTQDPGSKQNLSSETENSTWSCLGRFYQAPLFSLQHIRSPFVAFQCFCWSLRRTFWSVTFWYWKAPWLYSYLFVGQHLTEISSIMAGPGVFVAKYGELVKHL